MGVLATALAFAIKLSIPTLVMSSEVETSLIVCERSEDLTARDSSTSLGMTNANASGVNIALVALNAPVVC